MKPTARLPRFCSVLFAAGTVLCLLVAVALVAVIVIDHKPASDDMANAVLIELSPDHGMTSLKTDRGSTVVVATAVRQTVRLKGAKDEEFLRLMKRTALPAGIVYVVILAGLFDLMRRLFRNVARGDSFSPGSVRLVRIVGVSLIGLSLASLVSDHLLSMTVAEYFNQRAAHGGVAPFRLIGVSSADGMTFELNSYFFSGLLVLALSEVFRQGLKLKQDSELTI